MNNLFFYLHTKEKRDISMVILFASIILFNVFAYTKSKIPTQNRKINIWLFTIAMQHVFDSMIEFKYQGYWYFDKSPDWLGLLAHTVLIPPVNILLLSWYPYGSTFTKKVMYIGCWTIGVIIYEAITLISEPWGFFHLGWWELWFEFFVVPILILILVGYYKWIDKIEKILDNQRK